MSKRPLNLSLDIEAAQIETPMVAPATVLPSPVDEKRPVGRPKIEPRLDAKRISVTLDGETYKRVAHACIDRGLDRQQFLERAIELMLKSSPE